jgi:5-methyltetrahydrofolate corrinoid/iron sulfur protein methyltransferase
MKIIGEKINATIKDVRRIIGDRNEHDLLALARKQAEAGAAYIDINVGTGEGSRDDELDAMDWAVKLVTDAVDAAISVDSADPGVIAAGLQALNGRQALINSVKAEEKSLAAVMGLVKDHDCEVIALAMDEKGIPSSVAERLQACEKIASFCSKNGVELGKVYFDPLVLPISADVTQGLTTLKTIEAIKTAIPEAHTVLGLSNVSYGLPGRRRLNLGFLHMAVYAGLDAAIADPLDAEFMSAIKTAEVLVGRDKRCKRYTRQFR